MQPVDYLDALTHLTPSPLPTATVLFPSAAQSRSIFVVWILIHYFVSPLISVPDARSFSSVTDRQDQD